MLSVMLSAAWPRSRSRRSDVARFEAITASTLNAACALGRGGVTGSIEPGKRADLVVHDVPNRYHLVYRFGVPRGSQVGSGRARR